MKTKQQGGTIVVTDNEKTRESQGKLGKFIKEFFDWNVGCGSCRSCTNLQKIKNEAEKDQTAKTCEKNSDSGKGT
jgi:hypothetical protein